MIACYKVGMHNKIVFTKTKSMPGEYYISGAEVRKYKAQANGKLMCYCVPLDAIEKLEYREQVAV